MIAKANRKCYNVVVLYKIQRQRRMPVNAVTKLIFLNDDGEKFFGEGPCRLLHGVEEQGSLRASAQRMGMAYSKALKLVKNAEAALGFPLTTRTAGGKDGGGSRLTPEGKAWLAKYEAYRDACNEASREL
jgi:molybdate transport system regulatory protein